MASENIFDDDLVHASFSASLDYKRISSATKNFSSMFTLSTATCCEYTASIEIHDGPELSNGFKKALDELPESEGDDIYKEFIRNFGTHYISVIDMGAIYGQQTEFSKDSYERMHERGVHVGSAAKFSGMWAEKWDKSQQI